MPKPIVGAKIGSPDTPVVGFAGERLFLMPTGDIHGLKPNARVIPRPHAGLVRVGPKLLGRVVDGACRPLDGHGPIETEASVRLTGSPINPLLRQPITQTLDVGVRAINGLLTIGRGQRVGLFAGSGVGKSVLLGMMARYTAADVIVVGLIGERGREVKEFIERILGREGLARDPLFRHARSGLAEPPAPLPVLETDAAALRTARRQIPPLLTADPVQVDEIARRCQLSMAAVSAVLLELELAGRVETLPGNRVALTATA